MASKYMVDKVTDYKKRLRNVKDKKQNITYEENMTFSSLSEKLHMPRFLVKRAG